MGALTEQASRCTLSSRAFHNDLLGKYCQMMHQQFGYEMLLPMNTGVEAVETAIKLARKWAYQVKGVKENEAMILACEGNFHGRTMTAVSLSTDAETRGGFGPYLPLVGPEQHCIVPYGDIKALHTKLDEHGPRIAAFIVEPIQGEAGVIVPPAGYIKEARELCRLNDVLFIADEIQTGLGRTGKWLCCDWEFIRPDIVLLGKALSGGFYPVSAVLADSNLMLCIQPGQHGSTYGGNPLACAIAMESIAVIRDEDLCNRSCDLGHFFRKELRKRLDGQVVKEVRGKGLLNAIEIREEFDAWKLCLILAKNGVLAKPTHRTIIRLAPPLCITQEELNEAIEALVLSIEQIKAEL